MFVSTHNVCGHALHSHQLSWQSPPPPLCLACLSTVNILIYRRIILVFCLNVLSNVTWDWLSLLKDVAMVNLVSIRVISVGLSYQVAFSWIKNKQIRIIHTNISSGWTETELSSHNLAETVTWEWLCLLKDYFVVNIFSLRVISWLVLPLGCPW